MKKGYYIHFCDEKTSGVAKKIKMQMAEFQKYFDMSEVLVRDKKRSLLQRLIGLLPLCSIERYYENALEKIIDPDFVYIRRTVADAKYFGFLKSLKLKYPNCKILVEIYTYPYDKDEFAKWNAWPFFFKELIFRKRLKDVVDRFVTYSQDDVIFGVPCINTMNGVDVESIYPVRVAKKSDHAINLLAVANFQRAHGYERVIGGIHEYRGRIPIKLHLVGDGAEIDKYRDLVKKWDLQDLVIFYGRKMGEELETIYEMADIALGAFGLYKLGIESISTLKTSESLAKGLPVITGCTERALTGAAPYFYRLFPNDNKNIDMEEVEKFFESIQKRGIEKTHLEIRKYAENTVSMSEVLKPVVKYVLGDED